ncbi:hypothetical protein HAX54_053336, partial [Datura stramonium]|nr:hypothetical protein [Datura stramonium]
MASARPARRTGHHTDLMSHRAADCVGKLLAPSASHRSATLGTRTSHLHRNTAPRAIGSACVPKALLHTLLSESTLVISIPRGHIIIKGLRESVSNFAKGSQVFTHSHQAASAARTIARHVRRAFTMLSTARCTVSRTLQLLLLPSRLDLSASDKAGARTGHRAPFDVTSHKRLHRKPVPHASSRCNTGASCLSSHRKIGPAATGRACVPRQS